MVDRTRAIKRMNRILGFRASADNTESIVEALQDAQTTLEQREILPWFLESEQAYTTTTSGEERVQLPSDFLMEYEDGAFWFLDTTITDQSESQYKKLVKTDIELARRLYYIPGKPMAYVLAKDYFRIFPQPDAAYQVRMVYYQSDDVLNSNIENRWLKYASDLLIGTAGVEIARSLRNVHAEEIFNAMVTTGAAIVERKTQARKHQNRRYVMGGAD